ncbi:hypothetical protein [Acetonema longum]|uniref:Uncharacterized protein n=1 Tax=Acetonema longum DSM 6540 TaxID=1009370 RepID=F7NDH1_9FIRM|nr:hypothetical protein [Acetonema longum]EGO65924.1 hypothetical protein ALO_00390 [Acetonema longum DSM 6540]
MAHSELELDSLQPAQDLSKEKDGSREHMEVRYYNRLEKIERWRKEFQHNKEVEEELAAVSKLDFSPQDYTAALERVPFKEPPIPNFDYLRDESRTATEKKYSIPIMSKVGVLALLVISLFVVPDIIIFAVAGGLAALVSVWLYFTIQDRSKALVQALAEADEEIEKRTQLEIELIQAARVQHDEDEDERINAIERLLAGEPDAIMLRLYETLSQVGFPFTVDLDIDMHANVPLLKIWLPAKSIIPGQTCSLAPSGRINYEDKEVRQINKQYMELCSAVTMRMIAFIYENIPAFDLGYANGMVRDTMDDSCVLALKFDRQTVTDACNASTALAALQMTQVTFNSDNNLSFTPVEPIYPDEWEGVEQQMLRSAKFKVR